ncbi:type I pullulanase [Paenibacillus sp. WLX1005]|uniref:type I pullulanase n=1 Tax=Paenibacillus sp. WLX1005 TaxID=3243766 RepID=UPI00398408C1
MLDKMNHSLTRSLDIATDYFYDIDDLGLQYTPAVSIFKVWTPDAIRVDLVLYDDPGEYDEEGLVHDHEGGHILSMQSEEGGVWEVHVNRDLAGEYYMYRAEFHDGTVEYSVDPYARAVSANGRRTAIIDLRSTDPEGWDNDIRPPMASVTDAVIYELHLRDFSSDPQAPMQHKGKFLAFTETGLTDEYGNSVGIDHLRDLGVTHVHLLPLADFQTVNELTVDDPDSDQVKYNWGYDPQHYNVPEGSYATDPSDPTSRIREFKKMVQALHGEGMRVVMDVVYNHTFSVEDGPFERLVPGYFYRTDERGQLTNGSGVGNEIATERPMVRKYIKDSLRYWANEYHLDGFRFDLMGLIDTETVIQFTKELRRDVDPYILIYGEPWTGGWSPLPQQTLKGAQRSNGFALFNDNFRSAIKGGSDDDSKGFVTGEFGKEGEIVQGVYGSIGDFTDRPGESINYVTAHDNLNLWDKIVRVNGAEQQLSFLHMIDGRVADGTPVDEAVEQAKPYGTLDYSRVMEHDWVRRSLLANGIVLTSQGIPFIHAGDELLRSKYGDHNSYRSSDEINMIRWENKHIFADVFHYYRGLIQLRLHHPAFRMNERKDVEQHLKALRRDNQIVMFQLGEYANGDKWRHIIVIYNAATTEQNVTLPQISRQWQVVVNERAAGIKPLASVLSGEVAVAPLSMMVLFDEQDQYKPIPASLEWDYTPSIMEPGEKLQLHVITRDQRGRVYTAERVRFQSANDQIVQVRADGRMTALREGNTTICVSCGDVESCLLLHVETLVPHMVNLQGEHQVYAGKRMRLKADVLDQYGRPIARPKITWNSSDKRIARVNKDGVVRGISAGKTKITVTCGRATAQWYLEVAPFVPRSIEVEYERPNQDYRGWNLWVWGSVLGHRQVDFDRVEHGRAIARIPVAPDETNIGFIIRLKDWQAKDIDTDRYIFVDTKQDSMKVVIKSGDLQFEVESTG